jgi:hypothetical protein
MHGLKSRLQSLSSANDSEQDDDNCDDEKNMNQAAGGERSDQAKKPENYKYDSDRV